jgi:peptide/nickel transport system substrate-binding protein
MNLKRSFKAALAGLATTALVSVGLISPADAATRSTVVIVTSNIFTSMNPSQPDTNVTINGDISYVQGMGYIYYDDKRNLKKNTIFGSYKIVSNTSKGLEVQYTVNKGKVWSDGVPITAVDLLLSHVLSSSKYSIDAGLGDPAKDKPAFDSIGYGGLYDENVVGVPALSEDNMSLTVTYGTFLPDWELLGPGPSPVHTLVQMAEGKKSLGTVAEGNAAKAKFLSYFQKKDSANLKKIAKIWSEDYDTKTISGSTNPLLLVVNGAYMIDNAVADQSVTLKLNPLYNSGPKTSGVKTIVFRMLSDSTAASQALQNGEIDIYQGQATADAVAQLKAMKNVKVIGGTNACYEHIDVRVGNGPNQPDTYRGVFAGSSQRARDLRTAFLLSVPRQQIVDTLIKPINPSAVQVNSVFILPGQSGYDQVTKNSGVSKYTAGSQADRTAKALLLVKKYYPTAGNGNKPVAIKLLWGTPANARRAAEAQLIVAEAAKAGFDVSAPGLAGWSGALSSNAYDAAFFAWCPTSVSQTGTNANFKSDGGNNFLGYASSSMDATLKKLEGPLTSKELADTIEVAERLLIKDAVTLGIFQHPAVTAHTATLKNVKPAPLSPNLVWNFWEWKY